MQQDLGGLEVLVEGLQGDSLVGVDLVVGDILILVGDILILEDTLGLDTTLGTMAGVAVLAVLVWGWVAACFLATLWGG